MERKLQVLVFGPQAEAVGCDRLALAIKLPSTVAALRQVIGQTYPVLREAMPSTRVAVNLAYADSATPIRAGDEVALIGPVSGG